jgi:hypothetical protein
MRAWTSPEVPRLGPGPAPAVRVHDTSTGSTTATTPAGTARMYVCGITPYDATHIGHAATYIGFDLLNRAWRDAGHAVHYTQNVTDVDDPLLERAAATGVDWQDLAERETELFREDMTALRVLAPDDYVGAVESIPLDVELIQELQAAGHVYDVEGLASARCPGSTRPRCCGCSRSVGETPTGPARSTPSTACSGRPSGPVSRRGTPRWAGVARGGTSSAPRSR